jgi:hypothetical protein
MRHFSSGLLIGALGLLAAGCRGESYHSTWKPRPVDDPGDSIYDVQSGRYDVGDLVLFRDVVVVAIDRHGKNTGAVWVQDPAGGNFSGITIRSGMVIIAADGETEVTLDELSIGDLVDVSGMYDEFALKEDTTGDKVAQVNHPSRNESAVIYLHGQRKALPEPEDVDPLRFASDRAYAERWEGVPIRFRNVALLRPPESATASDTTLFEMVVSGPAIVQNGLFGFETPEMSITGGTCFAEIVGIGDYFFDYKIQPRGPDDIVYTGGDCPPIVETDLCEDGIDNDMDGHSDGDDVDCLGPLTLEHVQTGQVPEGSEAVIEEDLVITHIKGRSVWVQSRGIDAAYRGIVLYLSANAPSGLKRGMVVRAQGTVKEAFGTTTQLDQAVITCANAATYPDCELLATDDEDVPLPLDIAASELRSFEAGEPYESVLVRVTNLRYQGKDANSDYVFVAHEGETPVEVVVSKFLYTANPLPSEGQCLTAISGLISYYRGQMPEPYTVFQIQPRNEDDYQRDLGVCP